MSAADISAVDACIYLNGRKLKQRAFGVQEKNSTENCHSVTLKYRTADFSNAPMPHQDKFTDAHGPLIIGYADGGAKQPLAATFQKKRVTETAAETLWVGDMDSLNKVPQGAQTVTLERQKSVSDGAALMDIIAARLSKAPRENITVIERLIIHNINPLWRPRTLD